jgi:hypothetical protein
MLQQIELMPVVGSVVPSIVGFHGLAATESDHFLQEMLTIQAVKKVYPWQTVADWTHRLPTSPTEHWMDAVGRDQFFHRWKGHHIFSDGWTVLRDHDKSVPDFLAGLSKDVITIQGIPLLSDSAVTFLSNILGVPVHDIMPWVLKNAFDLTIGVLAIGETGYDLFLAFTGQMEWGLRTAFFTFGTGTAELAFGVGTKNPLLVMAGIGEYGAGIKCAWDYYTQPFFFGVPLSELLAGMGVGAAAGLTCSLVTMAFTWSKTTPQQKLLIGARSTAVGAVLGFLSAISPWVSIPVGLGWSFGSLAVKLANQRNLATELYRLSSPWALQASFREVLQTCGPERAFSLINPAPDSSVVAKYDDFLRTHQDGIVFPELNKQAESFTTGKKAKGDNR